MTKIEPDDGTTLMLGRGINTLTLEEAASAIDISDIFVPVGNAGQSVTYELRQVESLTSLRKTMNLSAGASFAGSIGAGGSVKANLYNSVQFKAFSLYLYVRVRVSNGQHALKNYQLTNQALANLTSQGEDRFFENYGEEFVAGYTSGGELIALITIDTSTIEEKTQSSISASGSYGRFSTSGEFSQALERFNFRSATDVKVLRRGGHGPIPDVDSIKQAALNFPTTVSDAEGTSVLLQVTTLPYSVVINQPSGNKFIELSSQKQALEAIALIREDAVTKRNNYQFVAENEYLFNSPNVESFKAAINECTKLINEIDDTVRTCIDQNGRSELKKVGSAPELPYNWGIPFEPPMAVMVHGQEYADLWGTGDKYVGTNGRGLRIEGISLAFTPPVPGLYIEYFVHGEGYADSSWFRDGQFAGTRGQNLRIEGFQIRLIGPLSKYYDVLYTGHFAEIGDRAAKNDEFCGTRHENRQCEGISVVVKRRI